jgi:hypothetical protein
MNLDELKSALPLPALLAHLGLGHHAKASCRSPLRVDATPSWGIYEVNGQYRWKDLATGEGGDEIEFLAAYLRLDNTKDFQVLVGLYEALAGSPVGPPIISVHVQETKEKPDVAGFSRGTQGQLEKLAQLRGFSVEALSWAQESGVLVFNSNWNGHEVYGVTDRTGRVLELRRLDGEMFPAYGNLQERKSHAIKGSDKSWPVGAADIGNHRFVMLTEGLPDFLAAHDFIYKEKQIEPRVDCAPVGMLGAMSSISMDALRYFAEKSIWIYPHADQAGFVAAQRWQAQLLEAGAEEVRIFDLSFVHVLTNGTVKDLNDLLIYSDPALITENPTLKNILPQ